jgi:hypothetical protein
MENNDVIIGATGVVEGSGTGYSSSHEITGYPTKIMDVEQLDLVNETLTHIDVAKDEVLLTTKSGRQIRLYHSQDCCESVLLEDIEGNIFSLIGAALTRCETQIEKDQPPKPEWNSSWTRTKFIFSTDSDTVILKWIGESNGYYSESVDIQEVVRSFNSEDEKNKQ